jgi:hypothetical protein
VARLDGIAVYLNLSQLSARGGWFQHCQSRSWNLPTFYFCGGVSVFLGNISMYLPIAFLRNLGNSSLHVFSCLKQHLIIQFYFYFTSFYRVENSWPYNWLRKSSVRQSEEWCTRWRVGWDINHTGFSSSMTAFLSVLINIIGMYVLYQRNMRYTVPRLYFKCRWNWIWVVIVRGRSNQNVDFMLSELVITNLQKRALGRCRAISMQNGIINYCCCCFKNIYIGMLLMDLTWVIDYNFSSSPKTE